MCPKEEKIPIPLKYFDVTRATDTNLDVLQEKRKDDYWNVDANRSFSDSWKGFKVHFIERETSKRMFVVWERLTKIQATARPENVRPEVWTKIGKAAQKRRKHVWAIEKPKLDNVRRLRGIYFIDPEYGE